MSNPDESSIDLAPAEDAPGVTAAPTADNERVSEHLDGIPDGAGCFEIWAHLSDERSRSRD